MIPLRDNTHILSQAHRKFNLIALLAIVTFYLTPLSEKSHKPPSYVVL